MSENENELVVDEAKRSQLKEDLSKRKCLVKFEKADGTIRDMMCTTNPRMIPYPDNPTEAEGDIPKEKDDNLIVVWDLEKEGWRSFRFERLQSWARGLG